MNRLWVRISLVIVAVARFSSIPTAICPARDQSADSPLPRADIGEPISRNSWEAIQQCLNAKL